MLLHSFLARAGEVPAILFRGEVICADGKEGFASKLEEVARHTQSVACLKHDKIFDYKTVLRELLGVCCSHPMFRRRGRCKPGR